jgi:Holliday junction resolvasome RuvABC endonuclease subunit
MSNILGLDASTNVYGWAILDTVAQKVVASGTIDMHKLKTLEDKLAIAFNFIHHLKDEHSFDEAVIEALFLKSVTTLETLSEMRGVTRLALNPLPLHSITTTEMKSLIGLTTRLNGQEKNLLEEITNLKEWKGKPISLAKKKDLIRDLKKNIVVSLVNERFGLSIESNDEADAIAIAYAYDQKRIAPPPVVKEKKVKKK